jgi:SynChlorMet cassette radical SAM/SPASM protein ScmF
MTEERGVTVPVVAQTPPLAQIYFYLTEGCNLACRHCWLAPRFDPELTATQTLDPSLFDRAISEAIPLGLVGARLTGGEPMLHPSFLAFLDSAASAGIALSIETNGTLITPEIAAALADKQVSVGVSVDGADAETHDGVRGVPGSFDAVTRGVRLLAAEGCGAQVVFTVMRANRHQLRQVVTLAEEIGAVAVKFNVVQPTGRGKATSLACDALEVGDYLRLGRFVDDELRTATPLRLDFDVPLAFRPLSRLDSSGSTGICGIRTILGVLPDGTYALCGIGRHEPDLVFGSVAHDDLAAIWRDHPVLRRLRDGLPARLRGICHDCVMSPLCLGSCIAQNYHRSRDLFAPFWLCEEAASRGLFPASRRRGGGREDTLRESG